MQNADNSELNKLSDNNTNSNSFGTEPSNLIKKRDDDHSESVLSLNEISKSNAGGRQQRHLGNGCNKKITAVLISLALMIGLIALGIFVWDDRKYYIVSLGIMVLSAVPLMVKFEHRKPQARELVVLAVMTALAVAGRVAFYMIPQFKPISAIIIITAAAFGAEAGFITGACSAFISNFFFGHGPWTPWQMLGFGVIGLLAGLIFRKGKLPRSLILMCLFGGLSVFAVYGFIVDTGSAFMYTSKVTLNFMLAVYAAGVPVNIVHAASTVFFLAVLTKPILKKLDRVKNKYGLLD